MLRRKRCARARLPPRWSPSNYGGDTITLVLLITLIQDARAEQRIPIPPQEVAYGADADGPYLTWWQASNATQIAFVNPCAGTRLEPRTVLLGTEAGKPGWHMRRFFIEHQITSCVRIEEFLGTDRFGQYGPFPFVSLLTRLPVVRR
jgi:hypothetical protein